MISFIIVFCATFVTDWIWTVYIMYASRHEAFKASLASSLIVILGAMTTMAYIENHWLVIPAVLGGALGTYIAVLVDKRKNAKQAKEAVVSDS